MTVLRLKFFLLMIGSGLYKGMKHPISIRLDYRGCMALSRILSSLSVRSSITFYFSFPLSLYTREAWDV